MTTLARRDRETVVRWTDDPSTPVAVVTDNDRLAERLAADPKVHEVPNRHGPRVFRVPRGRRKSLVKAIARPARRAMARMKGKA